MDRRKALWFVLLLCVAACATLSDVIVEKQKGGGTARAYPVPVDKAWSIAVSTLRAEGTDAIEEHKADGYMLTSTGANFVSGGTVIGIWIESHGPTESLVTAVTKRKYSTSVFTDLSEGGFHQRFAQLLSAQVDSAPASRPAADVAPTPPASPASAH